VTTSGPTNTGCAYTQTWTANYTDACGNVADEISITYTWTVDNTTPVATCPPAQNFCSTTAGTYAIPVVTATDNCGGTLSYSYAITGVTNRTGTGQDASGIFAIGVSTIEWTITDGCNNQITCQTEVAITETPVLAFVSATCAPSLLTYDVVFTNTIGTITTTAGTVSGNSIIDIPVGTNITITSNNNGCTATLGVTAPNCACPVIAVPQNPNNPVICEGVATPALSVDAPATGYQINWYADATGGIALVTATNTYTPLVSAPGTYTFYAENEEIISGCKSNRIAVTLSINALPTIACPATYTVTACNIALPAGATDPAAFSALGGATNGTGISFADGTSTLTGCTETTIRTYTATLNGCTATCTQNMVRTIDTEDPVLATSATSGHLGCNPTVVAPTFTGTDNCEGVITPVVTTSGPTNTGCAYSQTWTANYTDACGNAADPVSITYTWTIDTEDPVLATSATSESPGLQPERCSANIYRHRQLRRSYHAGCNHFGTNQHWLQLQSDMDCQLY
jgi:hypothetical protein